LQLQHWCTDAAPTQSGLAASNVIDQAERAEFGDSGTDDTARADHCELIIKNLGAATSSRHLGLDKH
jgi:hypothetical protein